MKKVIFISTVLFIVISLALFLIQCNTNREYFIFCNEHIVVDEFDMTQSDLYKDGMVEILLQIISDFEERSNATEDDFRRDLERYEFFICEFNTSTSMTFMKTFSGIPTNDWYWYMYGSWIKSYETITARQAHDFLQDLRNDPRNFDLSELTEQLNYSGAFGIRIEYRLVLHEGALYPLIWIGWQFYGPDGSRRRAETIINAASGEHYRWDDFPNFDPVWPSIRD